MGPGRTLKYVQVCSLLICTGLVPARAHALERFCDSSFQDCRTPLLQLIANEHVGIDIGFWFMEDSRYVTALIKQFKAGVRVRVLVDQRANATTLPASDPTPPSNPTPPPGVGLPRSDSRRFRPPDRCVLAHVFYRSRRYSTSGRPGHR